MQNALLSSPFFSMAVEQFERAADFLKLSADLRERLKWPKRIITVTCPIRLDNGEVKVFFGHRVQYHLSTGPIKGGLRYHPQADIGEVSALAMWMNWKCALMGLPYGGGKGGIACDPSQMSQGELERLTRRFTMEVASFIGPELDVMAPDMGTNEQTMAWIVDTYSTKAGCLVPGVVTGKPIALQGTLGRTEATGHGVAFTAQLAMQKLGIPVKSATAIVQGFGNVGSHAARVLHASGVKITAISDVHGAIQNLDGIDIPALFEFYAEHKTLAGFPGSSPIDPEEMLIQPCDVLVPAAIGMVINKNNAAKLNCKILAEGANGPTTPEADLIIAKRGDIYVIPDILCNGGGVTVSYFEWVQNLQRFSWSLQEVISRLETRMAQTFEQVTSFAEREKIPNRLAAQIFSIRSVAEVKRERGLFP